MPKKPKWNEKPCPACKEPCSVEAIVCPHCRTVFTQAQIDERKRAQKSENKVAGFGCLGLIAVVFLIGMCSGSEGEGEATGKASAASATGDAKADAIALYKSVTATAAPCDAASSAMADTMQRGDLVPAYRAADQAESACLGTGSEIRKLEVPESITGEHRKTLEGALEACDTAYVMKWAGARKLKDIVNGDAKPSDMVELEDTTNQFQRGQMLCVGGLVAAATALGATSDDLGISPEE